MESALKALSSSRPAQAAVDSDSTRALCESQLLELYRRQFAFLGGHLSKEKRAELSEIARSLTSERRAFASRASLTGATVRFVIRDANVLSEAPPELKQLLCTPPEMIRFEGRDYPRRDEAEAIFLRHKGPDATTVVPNPTDGPWLVELNHKYRPFMKYCNSRYALPFNVSTR